MARKIDWYVEQAQDLIERDSGRDKMFSEMERMAKLEYSLPAALESLDWVRKITTTAPYDAVKAGVGVLSGLDERPRVDPVSVIRGMPEGTPPRGDAAKERANTWERVLKWQFDLASRRSEPIREMAPHDAIMYDSICGQVIHLPTQIRAIEKLGGDPRRQKAAKRFGNFVVTVRNPKGIHARWSDYMPEAVLQVKLMDGMEIKDFWGKKAGKVEADEEYVLYDYCDYEERCVWVAEGDDQSKVSGADDLVILKDKYKYDFLPWVLVRGSGREEYRPLLFGAWKAEQWITANLIGTLEVSQAVAESGRPRIKVEGPNPQGVQYEFGKPGGEYIVPPGHDVKDMADRGLDPALREAFDRSVADMGRSTIPSILVTTEAQAGEPFSGYNLRIQQAVKSLLRQKRLTEQWFAGAYRQMLEWAEATGSEISGYGEDDEQYVIKPDDIDVDNLYLTVDLTPDVPLDRQQRILSAIQLGQQGYPMEKWLEELGDTDPLRTIELWAKQQLWQAELSGQVMLITKRYEMQVQSEMIALQMQQQQALMAQQGQPSQQPIPGSPQGIPGAEGQMVNPAMGGVPPAQLMPGATREQQTGRTMAGGAL